MLHNLTSILIMKKHTAVYPEFIAWCRAQGNGKFNYQNKYPIPNNYKSISLLYLVTYDIRLTVNSG